MHNAGNKTTNTYAVFGLNNGPHTLTGNTVSNDAANKPSWFIGGASGDWRNITGNWFFGAVQGYRENAGANDIYTGLNTERGGIG